MNCTNVEACGGDLVGTWNVTSSCQTIDGDMDVFLTALACATVPATGSIQTTGTITLNEDGTYADNTVTTGNVSFPLDSACLAISGVPVECDRVGSVFNALGWSSVVCSGAGGQCSCELSTEQQGGLGAVLPYVDATGTYSTEGTTLTIRPGSYSYCAAGDTLTVTPQVAGMTGSIELQREGTAASTTGSGGASTTGSGGASTTGSGGASTTGSGGASTTGMGGSGGAGGTGGTTSGGTGPCDIYEAAGHTCVAAHSTVRALFGAYDGPLYQVRRADGMMQDIPTKSPGGFADSSVQDAFCSGSTCTMWRLYDQSGHGNFLEAQTADSTVGGHPNQTAADAAREQLTVGGNQVYSLFTRPSQAYWNDGSQNGMVLGADPQGLYMVTSGTHFNEGCCYDYGNAQLDREYHQGTRMDTIYFGANRDWGTGAGDGPWVMADLENGMIAGGTNGNNPDNISLPFPYVTAMEKNDGTNVGLKGGDATQPTLTTMYEGPHNRGPVQKEGAVILGAGGDCCYSNNNLSEGTFYEGAMVSGYPSTETDNAIHANIVEAGYGQ